EPGDTLVIDSGRYVLREYDEDVLVPPSGAPDAWITIQGADGVPPVLAGREDLAYAVDLSGARYVRLVNLEITHDGDATGAGRHFRDGIVIQERAAEHVVLADLFVHHVDEFGFNAQDVRHLEIARCRFEHCGYGALGGPAGIDGGWRDVRIALCSLSYGGHYFQGGDGTQRDYDRPDGFGIEPSSGPILIEDTTAAHNRGDGLDSKAQNTTIRRCVVANNSCDGIKLWGDGSRVENTLVYGRGDGVREDTPWSAIVIGTETANASFDLVNVTVDDQLGGNYLMYVQYDTPDLPVRLTIRNAIFRGAGPSSSIFVGRASTLVCEHTLFFLPHTETVLEHGERAWTASTISRLGRGNRYGDPLFRAPAWGEAGDYRLKPGSPAIDAGGRDGAPAEDLDGRPRPRGSGIDLGAYEVR
ncbi:MAG: right-handed parallel beta-helix repeat-containing protein, partial [Planctomycetota bacterium]